MNRMKRWNKKTIARIARGRTKVALIEYRLDGKIDKVQQAITRIKTYDPLATGLFDTPYYVAYSGGKDSDALRILFELSGVRYELYHNLTTVDAPETMQYIRTIPRVIVESPDTSMWKLIVKKGMPPLRVARYCCAVLKERRGSSRFVVTGVRWEESVSRKSRASLEIQRAKRSEKINLNCDNDSSRRLFETCELKGKRVLNPIIDWTTSDVWEFLHHHGCESNPLYQCGYNRIGCIGCPCAYITKRIADFDRYPKYATAYEHAFDRMLARRDEKKVTPITWKSGKDVMDWWMREKHTGIDAEKLFDFEEAADGESYGVT